jgi:hypothetical protein
MIVKNYISNELLNNIYNLKKAINKADQIIDSLQKETDLLKEAVSLMENKDELVSSSFLVEA